MSRDDTSLAKNVLGVPGIVFLVLAAVAPLTGMIVIAAIGIAVGNGGGMVAAFLLATVVLLLFAVGYAQMSRVLTSAGGFYAFVVKGLGRTPGLVAGFIAMLGYNCFVAGAIGTSGFFTSTAIDDVFGLKLDWLFWSALSVALVLLLSRRGIAVSAKVLGASLILEVSILLIMDFSVLFRHGFSFAAFSPSVMFQGAGGLALLFAANAFIGFEATALFGEEARDPKRTIPRATYIAIGFIGVFAAFTTWAVVSAIGAEQAQDVAAAHLSSGDLVLSVAQEYLGGPLTKVMLLLLVVSLFAALLALHNSATRYLYALGRVGVLPRVLGKTSPRNGAPRYASIVQLLFGSVVALAFRLAGLDPVADLTASMTGFGTLGILTLQLFAAVAILVYFRRTRDRRVVKTLIAPGLGAVGLGLIVTLAIVNFPTLAGSSNGVVPLLPWLLLVVALAGLALAGWLRRFRPSVYDALETDLEREPSNVVGQ
ncbi:MULTISPECIES: APC family permease [Amycolatopsis]|uniref:Conserved putative membrane protein n=1 Tax=Amycolatopsis japonica TaxID=208439 RepID=A0A075USU4_9PSEU|nr:MULTISPECIES: APC family permease [Amycolatopsis]AIG75584.1 Conserved putative membrane protein [Amycolatopsis japonica]OKJ88923.1 amino acid permease [Amycolatopsis sp. CB00013]RSN44023.1 APC family permease [Amycolatopsis sp. WAC 04197]